MTYTSSISGCFDYQSVNSGDAVYVVSGGPSTGFGLHARQRRLNAAAEVARGGGLRGFVDGVAEGRVTGWAQCLADREAPVSLDILRGGRRAARVLANEYRADLRKAGIGSGCHGFSACVGPGELEVRRSWDGEALPWTEESGRFSEEKLRKRLF